MRFTAVITKEGKFYVAHCIELGVVLGKTIEEAQANLKEAVELYIDSFEAKISENKYEVILYPFEVAVGG